MHAKPKPAKDAPAELAAPAVLKRLQMDAHKFSTQIDDCEAVLATLYEVSPNAANNSSEHKAMLAKVEGELFTARDNFGKTAKILLAFDKGVAIERKEGEKISVEEAKEYIRHILDCVQIAHQKCRITMAMVAAKANSPEDFVANTDGAFSAAIKTAIRSALEDGVIPK